MFIGFDTLTQTSPIAQQYIVQTPLDQTPIIVREALLAIVAGEWDRAAGALASNPAATIGDAASLNLIGVVCQARGQWRRARRFYGKAMRADRSYAPAEQNMRRIYELFTFGTTNLPIALIDQATLIELRNLPASASQPNANLGHISLWLGADATMNAVKIAWDFTGYCWAIATVALATVIGWPLVHSALHLANANALMLYLLSVLWVSTHCSRGAAVFASVLGVAVFDFVFVEPYYTFAVAQREYLVIFVVMLVTALVISNQTHRVRQQAELARQAWERVETEFLRNTLLSGVSHELRTPLAAITGAATTIIENKDQLPEHDRDEMLDTIYSEAGRMDRLITNLLDMTRLESGGLAVKKEWQPLQEVVGSALRRLGQRVSGRSIQTDIPADLPLVQIDAVLIEQVLMNLLDNALQYTPAKCPIQIVARAHHRAIEIQVIDAGPGLPVGTEERVFQKFFRAGEPENGRGIGLGLAICRGIIQAHGGKIDAINHRAAGATFRFTLPIADDAPTIDGTA